MEFNMSVRDTIILTGKLSISLNGELVRETKNLVVTAGKTWIAARMKDTSTVMTHMGIGTGTTAAVIADTDLETVKGARLALSVSGGTPVANVITYAATFPAGAHTDAITEAGIFTAVTSGTMLARTVFAVVNKGASDSMTISWDITIS
jgi:hypothetical protein